MGSVDFFTHQIDHLSHLDERWVEFIHGRIYKTQGTVLTLGTLKNYPIFSEFIAAGTAVMKLYRPRAEQFSDWATLVRPHVESDWHTHNSSAWVLVYYPQDHQGRLLVSDDNRETHDVKHIIEPRRGLCVMYPGNAFHKIEPNPTDENRYSLVLMFKEKR